LNKETERLVNFLHTTDKWFFTWTKSTDFSLSLHSETGMQIMTNSPVRRHTDHACFLWVKPAGGSRHSIRDQHTRARSDTSNTRSSTDVLTVPSSSESSAKQWNSNSSSTIPASCSRKLQNQTPTRISAQCSLSWVSSVPPGNPI